MTKDGPRGDHQGWSTRVDRILARVPGWPTVKHADLPERQNDAVSNRLQIAFYYFFSDFFLLFFFFFGFRERRSPSLSSWRFPAMPFRRSRRRRPPCFGGFRRWKRHRWTDRNHLVSDLDFLLPKSLSFFTNLRKSDSKKCFFFFFFCCVCLLFLVFVFFVFGALFVWKTVDGVCW